jgi:hypothetical protein
MVEQFPFKELVESSSLSGLTQDRKVVFLLPCKLCLISVVFARIDFYMLKKVNIAVLVLLILIFFCQLYIVFLGLNPLSLHTAYNQRKEIEHIAKLANENPINAQSYIEIGKSKGFTDIEAIRKQSAINLQIYKDAKNGDKIVSFGAKMAIYRSSDRRLIYFGDTPGRQNENKKTELINDIIKEMISAGYLPTGYNSQPQIAAVADPTKLGDREFYANAKKGDLVLSFGDIGVVSLYNLESKSIVGVGKVNISDFDVSKEEDESDPQALESAPESSGDKSKINSQDKP